MAEQRLNEWANHTIPPTSSLAIKTIEMHTGGGPVRVIMSGYPEIFGDTILQKRRYVKKNLDHLRKMLILEPRGHLDKYGALLVKPDLPGADIAVLFMDNDDRYTTMCGHVVISLARLAVDKKYVTHTTEPETEVNIQCPCGMVKAFVEHKDGKSGGVRFHSVPAFLFASDVEVDVDGLGKIKVDISYGGSFYAFVSANTLGLDLLSKEFVSDVRAAGTAVTNAVRKQVKLHHPVDDMAFLCGTIVTGDHNTYSKDPDPNICIFGVSQVDRSPCGSGTTARIALQYAKGIIELGQKGKFQSLTKSVFTGMPIRQTKCGDFDAVVVEVSGHGHYIGEATFTLEEGDTIGEGFLLR